MIHGFLFGLGLAAAFIIVGSVLHRGLGRTIGGIFKLALWSAVTVAAFAVVVAVLFRLIAVGNQPGPQESARVPASNWLNEPEPAGCR